MVLGHEEAAVLAVTARPPSAVLLRPSSAVPHCGTEDGEDGRRPSAAFPRGKSNYAKVNWNCYIYDDGTTILQCGTRPNWLKAGGVSSGETRPNSRVKSCQIDISAHAGFSRPTQKGQQMGTFRLPGSPADENNQACKRLFL
jgi:hypothetical protein